LPHWLDVVVTLLRSDTANLKELARLAGRDPRYFYRGIDPSNLDLLGQDIDGIEFSSDESELSKFSIEDVLDRGRNIGRAKRSEERVALLLLLVFENPRFSRAVLASISEKRSKYAAAAIAQLKSEVQKSTAVEKGVDQIALIRMVRRHYVHAFPDSRAALFYYLTKHLSQFPKIKKYLQNSWTKSHSYAFAPYRQEIASRLR
jgi:hypothetical protein